MLNGKGGAGRGQGRKPKPPQEKQDARVMVNFTQSEAEALDKARGDQDRAEWIRERIVEILLGKKKG